MEILFSKWNLTCKSITNLIFKILGSVGKESTCNAGDACSIPGLEKSPGRGQDNLLHYSSLKNHMDGGAWQATVHRVTKS